MNINSETLLLPQVYPVLCAWCAGQPAVLGYSPTEHSHGICVSCRAELLQEATEYVEKHHEH
jgi:hypothetical protein